jgi:hypothetical protein
MNKVILTAAAAGLLCLACAVEEVAGPQAPARLEPTTPARVLANVATSFNTRNLGLLKDMLSPDFLFHFDPRDVGRHPPERKYVIPEFWYYDEFWTPADNMFILAYAISLAIPTEGVGTPAESETAYRAEKVPLSLRVRVDELNTLVADRGYCDFEFESYTGKEGRKHWRLTGWWDYTSVAEDGAPDAEAASFGRVLAFYR